MLDLRFSQNGCTKQTVFFQIESAQNICLLDLHDFVILFFAAGQINKIAFNFTLTQYDLPWLAYFVVDKYRTQHMMLHSQQR
ncbi:hypothetical protein D3C77_543860 [compost metagenome]